METQVTQIIFAIDFTNVRKLKKVGKKLTGSPTATLKIANLLFPARRFAFPVYVIRRSSLVP